MMVDVAPADAEGANDVFGRAQALAGNAILQREAGRMLACDLQPGFRIALRDKDIGILAAAARKARAAVPLGAVVTRLVGAMKAQGNGRLDHTTLLKQVEQSSGRSH